MLNGILEFFGLCTRHRFMVAYSASIDLAREVDVAHQQVQEATKQIADLKVERDLYKRESAAHAKSTKHNFDRFLQMETKYLKLANEFVGIQAATVSHRNDAGEVTRFVVELRKFNDSVEILSLVYNKKNQKRAHDLRDAINKLIDMNPEPKSLLREATAALEHPPVAKAESLLRPATAPAVKADGSFPTGNGKPKGFA